MYMYVMLHVFSIVCSERERERERLSVHVLHSRVRKTVSLMS